MKKQRKDTCPGCSRHCTRENVRCKRGRVYFAEKREDEERLTTAEGGLRRKRKWEKYTVEGGLAWRLIFVSMKAKKAMRRETIDEEQLMNALDEQDRDQLAQILEKLEKRL